METKVLVLNRCFQPVNVIGVQRAFCMLYIGAARALDHEYNMYEFVEWMEVSVDEVGEAVGTVRGQIRVPRVMVLQSYDRVPMGRVRYSRQNVFERDEYTCQYCGVKPGRRGLNIDHVHPRTQGGGTHWENVVVSCIGCNVSKGGRTPEQAGMRLRRKPKKPSWSRVVQPPRMRARYREWLPFLDGADASYWQ